MKMKWSILATAIFVVGVSCGPLIIPEPASELEPPKFDAIPFSGEVSHSENDVPTPASDLLPPTKRDATTPATDLVPPPEYDAPAPPATEILPPFEDNIPTLSTDLMPPPVPEDDETKKPVMLFLINVFAVKNQTAEDSNDVLHSDFMKEVPEETAVPLAMFLLVVEDENEERPVNLDDVAKDLEEEGFIVDKVVKDGETKLIKVDIGSVETRVKVDENATKDDVIEKIIEDAKEKKEEMKMKKEKEMEMKSENHSIEQSGKLMKVRRKRTICLKCMVDDLKSKKTYGGYGGGGCGGGCGGGGNYYPQPVYQQPAPTQIIVVPVNGGGGGGGHHHKPPSGGYYQPPPQQYQPPPQYHQPPPQTCNVCGGGHPGGSYGGGSYAQASASAQASANSFSY